MSPPDALATKLLVPQPSLEDFPEFVSIPIRIGRHANQWPDKRAVVCEGKGIVVAFPILLPNDQWWIACANKFEGRDRTRRPPIAVDEGMDVRQPSMKNGCSQR